ncbi:MAG: hypothetical protein H7246_15390 [Phycisphaerae bacterium]|nr:hypothetical protein [Saprospiraceae bacterium]
MKFQLYFITLLLLFISSKNIAQASYTGSRLALFDVQILQQKPQTLALRCRMANTGRQTLGTKKNVAEMVVEFDTIGLPGLLRGHESDIAEAARGNCPKLKPGEISEPIWLNVRLHSREVVLTPGTGGCAEMVFDTAFVEEWGERTMRLRYYLKNIGSAPAHFFSKNAEPIVNLYFVSGAKLTRGAIPAGNTSIQKGRETLDGVLLPGQVLEGRVEITLKDRSKFSPNIALEFDPAQAVDECGRTGNVWVLRLRY